MEILNRPRPLTDVLGSPFMDPSHVIRIAVRGVKPLPITVIVVPGRPDPGETSSRADVPANDVAKGTMSRDATMTIEAVAARSRHRLVRATSLTGVSRTHRFPSQKGNVALHSATRLTQGVPWLCGPVSRRVCSFVGWCRADDAAVRRSGSTGCRTL